MNGKVGTSDKGTSLLYSSDEELERIVVRLIEEGYAFTDEPAGWPPAAVLQNLKDRGLVQRSFTAITWSGSNNYRTYEVA